MLRRAAVEGAFSNTLSLMRRRLPRAVNLLAQVVVFPALFVGAPVSLSQRGQRQGWSAGRPGPVNLVGAVPLGAGAALLLWAMSNHYRAAPQGWEIRRTPTICSSAGRTGSPATRCTSVRPRSGLGGLSCSAACG
jgi:hypothetical protein